MFVIIVTRKDNNMKVYGVSIDYLQRHAQCVIAGTIHEMNDEEKQDFVRVWSDQDQVYTLEAFFYYLNAGMLDTENYYWVAV